MIMDIYNNNQEVYFVHFGDGVNKRGLAMVSLWFDGS